MAYEAVEYAGWRQPTTPSETVYRVVGFAAWVVGNNELWNRASDMPKRDEFSQKTKDAVAKRAAYVCSSPDCRTSTVAPDSEDPKSILYIGRAAHITAAAEGGPRYDASLSSEERSSAKNAIFLCANCADMIDDNGGAGFSTELLMGWKAEHDGWVRTKLNKPAGSEITEVAGEHRASGEGEITGLDIQGAAIIKPGTKVVAEGKGRVTGTRIGGRRDQ